jgi:hypothetical protein
MLFDNLSRFCRISRAVETELGWKNWAKHELPEKAWVGEEFRPYPKLPGDVVHIWPIRYLHRVFAMLSTGGEMFIN